MADERDPDFAGRARHTRIKFEKRRYRRFVHRRTHPGGVAPATVQPVHGWWALREFRPGSGPSVARRPSRRRSRWRVDVRSKNANLLRE